MGTYPAASAALRLAYRATDAFVSVTSLAAASSSAAVGWRAVVVVPSCEWTALVEAFDVDRSTDAAQPAMSPETTIRASAPASRPRRTQTP
ncbi:MAG: hypothetical protein E6J28_10550 [Chloroflexi bacterium]|nr:MAG: hypothetical protein E6J28_10550 [Chloroflexota bacterium]